MFPPRLKFDEISALSTSLGGSSATELNVLHEASLPSGSEPGNVEISTTEVEQAIESGDKNIAQETETASEAETSLISIITSNAEFYRFACLTGFILPQPNTQSSSPRFSPLLLRALSAWVYFLHFAVFIYVVIALLFGSVQLFIPISSPYSFGFVVGVEMIASAVPFVTMYPAVIALRRALFVKKDVSAQVLREAMQESFRKGYRIFVVISLINFVSLLTTGIYISLHSEDKKTNFVLGTVVFGVMTIIPSNLMLSGVYSFLLIEQRITRLDIIALMEELILGRLTDRIYLAAGKKIERRDEKSPIDLLLITASVETALCIILLIILAVFGSHMESDTLAVNVLFIISSFCKEIIIFVDMLYQVMKVNELADIMLEKISKDGDSVSISPFDSSSKDDLQTVFKKLQRIELYLAMKEYRIGSTIMHYRPSRLQLMLQIFSVGCALSTTVGKVLINIITSK